jgi:hypothetical protein
MAIKLFSTSISSKRVGAKKKFLHSLAFDRLRSDGGGGGGERK